MGDDSTGSALMVTSSDVDSGDEGSGCDKLLQWRSFLCLNNAMMTRGTSGLGLDCVCSAAVGHSLEKSARAGEQFMSRAPASHWLSALPSCALIGGETRGAARRAESGHDITSTTTIFVDINGSLIRTWADDRVV